ncbi:ead/Ea22-like family protein, partial [Salmonella enterica]|nr:ead/Ea22-like family protein [Salmonella enterica]
CTGATYDDKGCHYAEGRSIADDHYEQSRVTVVDVSNPDVLALLDENLQLQREKDAIEAVALALRDDMRQAREQLAAAERRIAELEAKLETADRLQDGAFRDGLKAGFSYGQTDDQSGFAQCMSAYSTRTDIGVKVE